MAVAKKLLEEDIPKDTVIILIDRMPFQGLKTEYYALASGTVSESNIRMTFPIDPRLIIKYGVITELDLEARRVHLTQNETIAYDRLVIALGCTDNYHGIPGAREFTNSIQSLHATRKTYQRLGSSKPYGNVTIVGGGLTGVEMASELRESRKDLNISIIEREPALLHSYQPKLREYVLKWFRENDIRTQESYEVERIEQGAVHGSKGRLDTDIILWMAGIQPSPVVQNLLLPKDAQQRLIVNDYYQLPDYSDVFVVGDCASLPFNPSAQVAEVQGKLVAEIIQAEWKGVTPSVKPLRIKGELVSLGKKTGFGMVGNRAIRGRMPRVLKLGVLWLSKNKPGSL